MKGAIFGMSIALLSRILNPLEKMEEKIKNLLQQGEDMQDLADQLGSTPGKVRVLQNVAGSLGVAPDKFREMVQKFADAVEKGREERTRGGELSPSTIAVSKYLNQKDLAEGFFQFLQNLKTSRQMGASEQLLRQTEAAVFGQKLTGASKRLVEANYNTLPMMKNPPAGSEKLDKAYSRTNWLANLERNARIRQETNDFVSQSQTVTPKNISEMIRGEGEQNARELKQLQSYDDMRRAADGIDKLLILLEGMQVQVTKLVGHTVNISESVIGFFHSGFKTWLNIFKSGKLSEK